MTREEAKQKLDIVINKSRVHFYKPIQIAEILFHQRTQEPGLNLLNLESYRTRKRLAGDRKVHRLHSGAFRGQAHEHMAASV